MIELGERLVVSAVDFLVGSTRPGAELVDAQAPRQLRDPRPDGTVVTELVEALVRSREHLLEDVLGIGVREAVALDSDRVDVAGEAFDEVRPCLLVAGAAARDQLGVGEAGDHAAPIPQRGA